MGLFGGGESKFESSVKLVPYPQQAVYNNISDLRNLEKVRDRVPGRARESSSSAGISRNLFITVRD